MSLVKKKLIGAYFTMGIIFGNILNAYADNKDGDVKIEGAEKIDQITDMIAGVFQKIGGVIIFIGAIQVAWSIASDNPESKNTGLKVIASGLLVLTVSFGAEKLLHN